MEVILIVEDIRKIEYLKFLGAEGAEFGKRWGEHLDCADLQGLHFLVVFVELAVGINLHLDHAVGQFLCPFFEKLGRLTFWGVNRHNMTELNDNGFGGCATNEESG